ncbi:restriction endonuclease subunit S [Alishewanella tabrizica]|uniref:Restriction endonuclease n=1 Tax=Alishewanella tabrizica TaxID=671278 RepID=A0ABQ2WCX0_9ALTE|nr:restriction endonuclease subunit S [Alishewanella tabrizica]GGW49101.1 restriction endonuclease [Alishewanella tabrizica]
MSSEWTIYTVQDIAEELADAPFGSSLKNVDYTDEGALVVQGKNIQGRSFDWSDRRYVSLDKYATLTRNHCKEGDLIFPKVGTIGKVGILTKASGVEHYVLSTNTMRLRVNAKLACTDFVYYFFVWPKTSNYINALNANSVQPVFNFTSLKKFQIALPPLDEQKRISSILRALDDRIVLLRETNTTLEAISQALYKSWFVDFDPVHANAGTQAPSLPAEIQALFPSRLVESPQGLIPEGWSWKKLDEAYEINPKRQLKKGVVAKYLDMASVQTQGHVTADVNDREFGSGTKFCNGDTLLARITPCLENGKTAFVDFLENDEIGWGSTEFVVLRPRAPLPEFHGYLLARQPLFRAFAIRSMSGTSGRQRVQNDVLGSFSLAAPDKEVSEAFDQVVTPIQQSISANHKKALTLANLRDTLLPRLISGQLRLPEAEAILASSD